MQFRIFSIPATGSPDLEEELNLFLRSHRIVSTQKTLQPVDGVLRWCFCVEYLDGAKVSSNAKPSGRTERIDYKEVLPPEDFALFARLREVRKELAAVDAIPVYTVCTNEQLAEMASKRPGSLTALKVIEGLGEAKVAKYGQRLLDVIAAAPAKGGQDATGG